MLAPDLSDHVIKSVVDRLILITETDKFWQNCQFHCQNLPVLTDCIIYTSLAIPLIP